MHMIAEGGSGVENVNDVPTKIARVRSGEPHPADSTNRGHGCEQLSKCLIARWIPIRVNVLPEQLNLGISQVDQLLRFVQDRGRSPRPLLPACVRNHAVGAKLVASL